VGLPTYPPAPHVAAYGVAYGPIWLYVECLVVGVYATPQTYSSSSVHSDGETTYRSNVRTSSMFWPHIKLELRHEPRRR
jgi:hypothetical protein